MTSQPGLQTTAIRIFTNISISEGHQAMKFGQLIEHNIRIFFFEKSYTKCGRETIPRPFSKNQNCAYLWNQYFKVSCFVLIVCQVEDYRK